MPSPCLLTGRSCKDTEQIEPPRSTSWPKRPPHRSQRAELPHWAPTLGDDAKALAGISVTVSDSMSPASDR